MEKEQANRLQDMIDATIDGENTNQSPRTLTDQAAAKARAEATKPDNLPYEDFAKLDIRVGRIVSVDPVPKSTKLLKLEVSFGELGIRTIVAGIAGSYDLLALPGLWVVAVLNLAPRAMMGITSHGMLLAGRVGFENYVSLIEAIGIKEGTSIG